MNSERKELTYRWLRILVYVFVAWLVLWLLLLAIVYLVPTISHPKTQDTIISIPQWQQTRDTNVAFVLGCGITALLGLFIVWFAYDEEAYRKQKEERLKQLVKEEVEKQKLV